MSGGLVDTLSVAAQAAQEKAKRIAVRLRRPLLTTGLAGRGTPQRLLLAPQDLRTPDPTSASDLYSGIFFLAGKTIDCRGADPFSQTGAPQNWQRELHAFGWIRHLDAEGSARSKSNIQALIADWLATHSRPQKSVAWEVPVTAGRLIAWLCHSVPMVEAASPQFYQTWLKSIGTHIRFLKYRAEEAAPGLERLTVRIALAYAAICVSDQTRNLRHAATLLDEELATQVFADGGHVSRNPQALVELLTLLLPLRESCKRLATAPSSELISAIDRMMAAVKFYRLGDGNLARFNGSMGARTELLATVLQYDDSFGTAPESAAQSSYQRLQMGDTIILADTGTPPPMPLSQNAHAGALSFELSSGSHLVMINCGRPVHENARLDSVARSTAAHNTLTLNDESSSRFYRGTRLASLLGGRMIAPLQHVTSHRKDIPLASDGNHVGGKIIEASHDGYLKRFGVIHSRKLHLRDGGNRIEGTDRLFGVNETSLDPNIPADFAIRFHLHPSVSAGKTDNGASIIMLCGNGLAWKLTCIDCLPEIEESIYFSAATGPKRSKQIVLAGSGHKTPEVRWLLTRQTGLGDDTRS